MIEQDLVKFLQSDEYQIRVDQFNNLPEVYQLALHTLAQNFIAYSELPQMQHNYTYLLEMITAFGGQTYEDASRILDQTLTMATAVAEYTEDRGMHEEFGLTYIYSTAAGATHMIWKQLPQPIVAKNVADRKKIEGLFSNSGLDVRIADGQGGLMRLALMRSGHAAVLPIVGDKMILGGKKFLERPDDQIADAIGGSSNGSSIGHVRTTQQTELCEVVVVQDGGFKVIGMPGLDDDQVLTIFANHMKELDEAGILTGHPIQVNTPMGVIHTHFNNTQQLALPQCADAYIALGNNGDVLDTAFGCMNVVDYDHSGFDQVSVVFLNEGEGEISGLLDNEGVLHDPGNQWLREADVYLSGVEGFVSSCTHGERQVACWAFKPTGQQVKATPTLYHLTQAIQNRIASLNQQTAA